MKFIVSLFLIFLSSFLAREEKNEQAGMIESFLEKNIRDQLHILPLNIDKYQQNSDQIDLNQENLIKNIIQTTSLLVENHVFYILDKTTKTNYIEQMASMIEKVLF